MSEVALFNGQKVAAAFRHLPVKPLAEGISGGGFSSINYRGKVWTLKHGGQSYPFLREDDGTPLSYLDVIIVGVSPYKSKAYYPEWNEDSAGAPTCSSVKGDTPDPGVPEPQSKACAICPHDAWKTLPNGRQGRECQDHKRMAILLMPSLTKKMLGSPLLEPIYLKIPPGSLTSLKTYSDSLVHQGFPFEAVVTRISFAPDKLFQMTFKGLQVLSDKEAELVLPLIEDARTKRIVGEQPEFQEVAPAKEEAKPVNTGLMEAFDTKPKADLFEPEPEAVAPARRGRGRPPKNPVVIEAQAEPEPPANTKPAVPWGPDDADLDSRVADVLSRKTMDMLK